jgi:putative transposase
MKKSKPRTQKIAGASTGRLRIVTNDGKAQASTRDSIASWLGGDSQALLPLLELLEGAKVGIAALMNEAARGVVEHLLEASAEEIAGVKLRGRAGGEVVWHGTQPGVIALAERQLQIERPRLRTKNGKEVPVPAYQRASAFKRLFYMGLPRAATRRYCQKLPAR